MRRMRVLFMQSQSYFGSDSLMHSLIMRHLDRDAVEVYAACNRGTGHEPSASLRALRGIPDLRVIPMRFGPTVFGASRSSVAASLPSAAPALGDLSRLAWHIRRWGIDVIHGTEKPRDAFYGALLARATGARLVVHLHVGYAPWLSPLVSWAMRRADAIIGVSGFVAETAVAGGHPRRKVHSVLNGLEAERWDPGLDGTAIRERFDIPAGDVVLAIVSRLYHWKGHLQLLRALAEVTRAVPNVRLLVVGEDDPRAAPGRGSLTAEAKALARDLGILERVTFTGFREDVPALLAAADIFAMPTFEEPCAVAYLEAMAMGKPVVGLRSGGTPELVEDGRSGLLSEPGDIDQLAANIVTLATDPELRQRMGRHGRHRVETFLTPQRMAADCLGVYRQVISPAPAPITASSHP